MSEVDNVKKTKRPSKKYLWFGYGNYGGLPNLQIGGGNVRDPGLFETLSGNQKKEGSPVRFILYAAGILLGLMLIVMLAAWGFTLLLR